MISRSLVQICYSLQLSSWNLQTTGVPSGSDHSIHSQKLQYHTVCLDVMACHSDLLLSSLLAQALVSLIIVDISRLLSRRRTDLL